MSSNKIKKIALYGLMVALAFIFSYIETMIPFNFGIPGMKLGLANIVIITALYRMGAKEALIISLVRIALVGSTFSNPWSMLFSLAGGISSLLVMMLLKKTNKFSTLGVSVAGGLTHNLGQFVVAVIVMQMTFKQFAIYLPSLLIMGTITGVLIGVVSNELIKRLPGQMK